jgi:sialic acid synthase SpsE
VNIAAVEIGGSQPCRFVAEISNAHNGDLGRALRLIDAAKEAGADFVKFQCYTPDELVALRGDGPAPEPWGSEGWTMRALYEKAQTPLAWFPRLAQHCRDVGLPWFSSVFGEVSFRLLRSLQCPAYKVARLDNTHRGLRNQAHMAGRPVLVSSSGFDPFDGSVFPEAGLLYCPPGYPTPAAEVHLPIFGGTGDRSDPVYLGLSSHCLAPELPVAAVARGAKLIEMHLMLAEEPSALEADVSLTQYQYAAMVQSVRNVEAMLA